jgi:hypothetical protein
VWGGQRSETAHPQRFGAGGRWRQQFGVVRRHFEPCFDDPRVAATQNIGRGVGEVITKHANRCPPPKPQRPFMVRNEAPPDPGGLAAKGGVLRSPAICSATVYDSRPAHASFHYSMFSRRRGALTCSQILSTHWNKPHGQKAVSGNTRAPARAQDAAGVHPPVYKAHPQRDPFAARTWNPGRGQWPMRTGSRANQR